MIYVVLANKDVITPFTLTVPTLISLSAITFSFSLGIFSITTHYLAIIALRIRNTIVSIYFVSWLCFLASCILTLIQLANHGGWICIVTMVIIVVFLGIISYLLYFGVRIHSEYIIFKTMDRVFYNF